MNRKDLFPSNWLKADDVPGTGLQFTMRHVDLVEIKNPTTQEMQEKPVLYFEETDKGLILNATNYDRIASLYGDNTDHWMKKVITLGLESVTAFGKTDDKVRVKLSPI